MQYCYLSRVIAKITSRPQFRKFAALEPLCWPSFALVAEKISLKGPFYPSAKCLLHSMKILFETASSDIARIRVRSSRALLHDCRFLSRTPEAWLNYTDGSRQLNARLTSRAVLCLRMTVLSGYSIHGAERLQWDRRTSLGNPGTDQPALKAKWRGIWHSHPGQPNTLAFSEDLIAERELSGREIPLWQTEAAIHL